ncbi:MAG: DUF3467 domain-containing protein [Bacteroidetes bacterium]|nr:MAG: DUF3467 domain-containing protein [Bacteroidota bacterium]TAG89591.1 MAG: DUF3467 domain-containing protein [Bacteroidota bacterium]
MAKHQNPQMQLDIELSDEIAEGSFSDLVSIAHSNSEFVLDFIRVLPGTSRGKVKARIIITPEHAKRLLDALGENIGKYEESFGDITTKASFNLPMNFGKNMGNA